MGVQPICFWDVMPIPRQALTIAPCAEQSKTGARPHSFQPREESSERPFMIITLGTVRSMRPTMCGHRNGVPQYQRELKVTASDQGIFHIFNPIHPGEVLREEFMVPFGLNPN